MRDAWIIDAVRTPIGRVNGKLAAFELHELLAGPLRALLDRNHLDAAQIDEVIVGNAAGPGGNPARVALLEAGFPVEIPGVSVDRQCGSGLEAINIGARLVQSGAASVVIAGGAESASTAPVRSRILPDGSRQEYRRARFAPDSVGDPEMGVAAENVARKFGIDRARQDAFALSSHRKAVAAQAEGRFDREIVPLHSIDGRIEHDECPRVSTSMQALAALPPVFKQHGSVTAGNSCPINDGASLVLISSDPALQQACRCTATGRVEVLRFVDACASGVDPVLLGIGPVPAVRSLLQRRSVSLDALAQIEFNEAFAAQVLASLQLLGADAPAMMSRVNPGGGALALGHPWGASGAVLVTRLFHDLRRSDQQQAKGLATLGIGGGLGLASLFERHCL